MWTTRSPSASSASCASTTSTRASSTGSREGSSRAARSRSHAAAPPSGASGSRRAPTCLVQYDVYHRFSADQHSLLGVEHLEALAPGQSAESEGAAQVFNEVDKPELLMLGMLLHDIGKAKGHGHVAKGIPLVRELVVRMGLEPADGAVVEFLVAHHLTLSH